MGNNLATRPEGIDDFTSAFVASHLREKHEQVYRTAEKVLTLSEIPFTKQALHRETNHLMQNSIALIRSKVNVQKNIGYRYYFSKDSKEASLLLEKTAKGPVLKAEYPLECILSRKACIRLVGIALAQATKPPFQLKRSGLKCFLRMPVPVQLNLLISLAALGVFIKKVKQITKNGRDEVHFLLTESWPIPILPKMDPGALQFRTIFSDNAFWRSEFDMSTNDFKWRKKTSYRYQELAYMKRNHMLMMEPTKRYIDRMREIARTPHLNKHSRSLYIEMYQHRHQNTATAVKICFVGNVVDFLRKYDLLPDGSNGKMQLLNSWVHTYPLQREIHVSRLKDSLNRSDHYHRYTDKDFDWRRNDLLRLPELGLRHLKEVFPLFVNEDRLTKIVYDSHKIVDTTEPPERQVQQRYLVHIQNMVQDHAQITT